MNLFEISFLKFTLTDLLDLALVTFIFSYSYSYFRGTRGGQMLIGLLILFFAGFVVNILGFRATSWLLNLFQAVWVVVFVILFQPEIRRLLTALGQNRIIRRLFQIEEISIEDEIVTCIGDENYVYLGVCVCTVFECFDHHPLLAILFCRLLLLSFVAFFF